MTEPTETKRREMNRRLARAMGWTQAGSRWRKPGDTSPLKYGNSRLPTAPPDFTRDLAASRELVEWIAKDLNTPYCKKERIKLWNRWWRLLKVMALGYEVDCPTGIENAVILTAPPLLIAIAADAATGGKDGR